MILETFINKIEHVDFDPRSPAHLRAYHTLKFKGRQTSLRFNIQRPFPDVMSMMQHKIAQEYLTDNFGPGMDFKYD